VHFVGSRRVRRVRAIVDIQSITLRHLGEEIDALRAIVMPSWILVATRRAEELGWEVQTGTEGMAFIPPRGQGRTYVAPLPLSDLQMQGLHRGELFEPLDLNGAAMVRYLSELQDSA
jgi:hypothetical protein